MAFSCQAQIRTSPKPIITHLYAHNRRKREDNGMFTKFRYVTVSSFVIFPAYCVIRENNNKVGGVKVWGWGLGFICLSIGTRNLLLWIRQWTFGFHEIRRIPWRWTTVSLSRCAVLHGVLRSSSDKPPPLRTKVLNVNWRFSPSSSHYIYLKNARTVETPCYPEPLCEVKKTVGGLSSSQCCWWRFECSRMACRVDW